MLSGPELSMADEEGSREPWKNVRLISSSLSSLCFFVMREFCFEARMSPRARRRRPEAARSAASPSWTAWRSSQKTLVSSDLNDSFDFFVFCLQCRIQKKGTRFHMSKEREIPAGVITTDCFLF